MTGEMGRLLIDSCEVVATMDDEGTEEAGGSILIDDGVVAWVGRGDPPSSEGAERLDGRGTVALPGLVNTHHHLYQSMTRVRAQQEGLFGWLTELYPIWAGIDQEWELAAARVGLAELALSGCTTTTDHHYVFPAGVGGLLEAEIQAASEIGIRFHPCRGSMDLGVSGGGLPPDSVVQDTDVALAETESAVGRYHDPEEGSMLRMAIAPCSPFSATDRLMRESAELARRLGVRLHTHIAETMDEERFCMETFGRRPVDLLDDLGYLGKDVWLAHCIHLSDGDIQRFAATGSSVAWCPTSNLRVAGAVARSRDLLDGGVTVGLGVDGSASNDVGDLLQEVRNAMLVTRGQRGAAGMDSREALRVGTRGGAACLGRDDVGSIEVGKRADIALWSIEGIRFAGAQADPVAAVVFCPSGPVRHLFVEGRPVVREGHLVNRDEEAIAAEGMRVGRRVADWADSLAGVART